MLLAKDENITIIIILKRNFKRNEFRTNFAMQRYYTLASNYRDPPLPSSILIIAVKHLFVIDFSSFLPERNRREEVSTREVVAKRQEKERKKRIRIFRMRKRSSSNNNNNGSTLIGADETRVGTWNSGGQRRWTRRDARTARRRAG